LDELEQRRTEQALECTQRMVDLALFDVSAWLLHGDVLLQLGRPDRAKVALQRAVDLQAALCSSPESLCMQSHSRNLRGRFASEVRLGQPGRVTLQSLVAIWRLAATACVKT
jgi:hypothetical protein